MKIAFLTQENFDDPITFSRSFSGITKHMLDEFIAQGDEIICISNINYSQSAFLVHKFFSILNKFLPKKNIYKQTYHAYILKSLGKNASNKLKQVSYDLILTHSSLIAAYLQSKAPLIMWRDANYQDLRNTYKAYTEINKTSQKWADKQEFLSQSHSLLNLYSSECSKVSSINYYHISPESVYVVPFGANLDEYPNEKEIEISLASRLNNKCINLLFFGIEWERKGGNYVIELLNELLSRNLEVHLHVVGINSTILPSPHSKITFHGFLKKSNPEEFAKLNSIISNSHFLVHPAIGEAYGCALCEACAYGVPIIASDVGGIPTIVLDDYNGYLFAHPFNISKAADIIEKCSIDKIKYSQLVWNSYKEFNTRLNWKTAISQARQIINDRCFIAK